MIKTHRPRGYFWTCTSLFQESKQFGEIEYEDCAMPRCSNIAADPDECASASQRATKRQRIEKIANEFMLGVPIRLESTAFRPHNMQAAIEWNQRSLTEKSFTLAEYREDGFVYPTRSDVDSENRDNVIERSLEPAKDAILQRRSSGKLSLHQAVSSKKHEESTAAPITVAASARPSTGTLDKAAALCKTQGFEAGCEVQILEPRSGVTRNDSSDVPKYTARRSMANTRRSHPDVAGTRRQILQNVQDEDDSRDELRLSRSEVPLQSPESIANLEESATLVDNLSARMLVEADTSCRASWTSGLSSRKRVLRKEGAVVIRRHSEGRTKHDALRESSDEGQGSAHPSPASAAKAVYRDLAACSDAQHTSDAKAKAPQYIVAPTPSDGSTPFVYRKRGRNLAKISKKKSYKTSDSLARQQSTPCRPIAHQPASADTVNPSMAAQKPATPLVDAHLNVGFACMAGTTDTGLSLRKAIQRELRRSGAIVSDIAGNVPASSPEAALVTKGNAHTASRNGQTTGSFLPTSWEGTKKLLQEAERELFMSHVDVSGGGNRDSIPSEHERITDKQDEREPLRELLQASQENAGTQTLVEVWSPWSTVKKPSARVLARLPPALLWPDEIHSIARPSSLVLAEDSPAVHQPLPRRNLRRSSSRQISKSNQRTLTALANLGFLVEKSQSSTASSSQKCLATNNYDSMLKAQDSYPRQGKQYTSNSAPLLEFIPNNRDADCQTSGSTIMATDSTGVPLPSYEAAQQPEDESQVNGIINDLTTSLLRTDDLCGVLGEI